MVLSIRIIIECCVIFSILLCLLINFTYKNSHIVSIHIFHHNNNEHHGTGTSTSTSTSNMLPMTNANYHLIRFLHKRFNTTITKLQKIHNLHPPKQQQHHQNPIKSQQEKQQTHAKTVTVATSQEKQTIHRKLKARNDDNHDNDIDIDTDVDIDNDETDDTTTSTCPCGNTIQYKRPDVTNKVGTARWMVHTLDWGILSTISTRTINTTNNNETTVPIVPFGNVYSFIDGSCSNSTGIPYMYGSYLDQSFKDILLNSYVSLTLSEATIRSTCIVSSYNDPYITDSCVITQSSTMTTSFTKTKTSTTKLNSKAIRINNKSKTTKKKQQHHEEETTTFPGDPESPLCARLTITGKLMEVTNPNQKSNMYHSQRQKQEENNKDDKDHTNNTSTNDKDHNNNDEYNFILQALYERHPQMKYWPTDHHWTIMKLNIIDVWLIDYFGGATTIQPKDYFQYRFN